jgi:hypothetical protein
VAIWFWFSVAHPRSIARTNPRVCEHLVFLLHAPRNVEARIRQVEQDGILQSRPGRAGQAFCGSEPKDRRRSRFLITDQ